MHFMTGILLASVALNTMAFIPLSPMVLPRSSAGVLASTVGDSARMAASSSAPDDDSLTKAELNARFRDVLAHFQATGELTDAQALENLLRTRLPQLALRRCRVEPSPFHGSGVFATRALEPGELVTCYPGDAVLVWDEQTPASAQTAASQGMRVLLAPHLANQDAATCFVASSGARDYEIRVRRLHPWGRLGEIKARRKRDAEAPSIYLFPMLLFFLSLLVPRLCGSARDGVCVCFKTVGA